jgi:hypothetical protein
MKLYDKRDNFNFPIVNFPFICSSSNIPAPPAYGVCISQLIQNSRACSSYQDFLDRGLLLTRELLDKVFLENVTVATMTWLTVMEYLCQKWPRICSIVVNTSRSFPCSWLITESVTGLTRWASLVEQELLTLQEHPSSPPVFIGVCVTRSLVLCVCFVDRCLSFCTFSFGHCVVCSSSIYGF